MSWEFNPPPARPGEPILASHVQAILEVRDKILTEVAAPLAKSANTIYLEEREPFWILITGAPGGLGHPWTEQIPIGGGLWQTGYQSGTASNDPAYEVNGSTSNLTNKYVLARRDDTSGEVRFIFAACSAQGGGGGPGLLQSDLPPQPPPGDFFDPSSGAGSFDMGTPPLNPPLPP